MICDENECKIFKIRRKNAKSAHQLIRRVLIFLILINQIQSSSLNSLSDEYENSEETQFFQKSPSVFKLSSALNEYPHKNTVSSPVQINKSQSPSSLNSNFSVRINSKVSVLKDPIWSEPHQKNSEKNYLFRERNDIWKNEKKKPSWESLKLPQNLQGRNKFTPIFFKNSLVIPSSFGTEPKGSSESFFSNFKNDVNLQRSPSPQHGSTLLPASSDSQYIFNPKNISSFNFYNKEDTEESNSVELELSLNGRVKNESPHISISNPHSKCIEILKTEAQRTLLNIWSVSKSGTLKLESQKEIPSWILNGTRVTNGEILNRDEIPPSISNGLSVILGQIGASGKNGTSGGSSDEKLLLGNRRGNTLLLHYVLWGNSKTKWKVMLDKTVENYLRNYFLSTFGQKRRFARVEDENGHEWNNWRKMRNVVLNFMAAPESNCDEETQDNKLRSPIYIRENELNSYNPHSKNQVIFKPPSNRHPNPHMTRQGFENIGWQQQGGNSGWGAQNYGGGGGGYGGEVQSGGGGYGWGWGEEDKKSSKKAKKKAKKQKKKEKKKKKKWKKKEKKKRKKSKKKGGGGGGGWGWMPQQIQVQRPQNPNTQSGILWQDFEINPGELLNKGLSLLGLLTLKSLPFFILIGIGVIIYLLAQKHGGKGTTHYSQNTSPPQIIYTAFPTSSSKGWRRRTERPFLNNSNINSNINNKPLPKLNRNTGRFNANRNNGRINANTNSIKPIKKSPTLFSDIQNVSRKGIGIRNGDLDPLFHYDDIESSVNAYQSYPEYIHEHRVTGNNYNYDDSYSRFSNVRKNYAFPTSPKTQQEEELVRILSKHKKEELERLLSNWKLAKMKKYQEPIAVS